MSALDLLRRQHEEIQVFCAKLRELRGTEARRRTVAGLARLVRSHASLEEEFVYPKLEGQDETAPLADSAFRDHETFDEVLVELEACPPEDEALLGIIDELEELFGDHLVLEEERIFVWLEETLAAAQLAELGRAMAARFAELTQTAERPAIGRDQLPEA